MARKHLKPEVIGVLTTLQLLRMGRIGHVPHATGTGAHRSKKHDKKLRRKRDRKATKGWD